jgi:hypothetical protein
LIPNQSKKEVNGTVILPPLVFPGQRVDKAKSHYLSCNHKERRIIKTDKKRRENKQAFKYFKG